MQFFVKLLVSLVIITICSQIGGKFPKLAGLIATMPLTGLLVFIWLYYDNPTGLQTLIDYARGALWGIGPSILFFLAAWLCLRWGMGMGIAVCAGAVLWLAGAVAHQLLLRSPGGN